MKFVTHKYIYNIALIRFGVHIKFSIITTSFVFHIGGNVEQTDQDEDTGM